MQTVVHETIVDLVRRARNLAAYLDDGAIPVEERLTEEEEATAGHRVGNGELSDTAEGRKA